MALGFHVAPGQNLGRLSECTEIEHTLNSPTRPSVEMTARLPAH